MSSKQRLNNISSHFKANIQVGGATTLELNPQNNQLTLNITHGSNSSAPASPALASSAATSATSGASQQGKFTLSDVAKHNTETDCWVVVNGKVLDATKFLSEHPGGRKAILLYAGKDATEEFNMLHKPDVVEKYAAYTIMGDLVSEGNSSSSSSLSSPAPPSPAVSAQPSNYGTDSVFTTSPNGITGDFSKPNNTMSLDPLPPLEASDKESRVSGGTAGILPAERKKALFEVEKMTNLLDGGPEKTKRRRWIVGTSRGTDLSDRYNWNRHEMMRNHVKHFIDIHDEFMGSFIPTREEVVWMSDNAMNSGSMMNHWGLFVPTLLAQCDDNQKIQWLPRAGTLQIIGSYGQTELGHGSNVRGLQTTAVYDKQNQEFVLNTPTLQSIKWWPGTLGKIGTHAVVYAQLTIDGKEYGVHAFMVQIRDENHRPLKGIALGDLGTKFGDHSNDTGFMAMENVRIPRENMLAKYQHIDETGNYVKSEKSTNPKLHYATMMFTRGGMVRMAAGALARGVTIAVRYSCVRKQGFVDTKTTQSYKDNERQIIDYQMQRYRLFKQLALTYAMKFTGKWMTDAFNQLEAGEGLGSIGDTTALPEIAATSAGLKGVCTFLASQGIEDCRKCCGGNGYLLNSGIAALGQDYLWQTTAEGDFIILLLQTGRFLLKSLKAAHQGKPVSGPVDYLKNVQQKGFSADKLRLTVKSPNEFFDLETLLKIFQFKALTVVIDVAHVFEEQSKKLAFDDAFNSCAVELIEAVRIHSYYFMLQNFVSAIQVANSQDKAVGKVLHSVCVVYALSIITEHPWAPVLDHQGTKHAKSALVTAMEQMRPNAVALVDAFDIPDRVLNSTIGRADGNIYEALVDAARKSSLNKRDPYWGYDEVVRPKLDLEFLKEGNKKWLDSNL